MGVERDHRVPVVDHHDVPVAAHAAGVQDPAVRCADGRAGLRGDVDAVVHAAPADPEPRAQRRLPAAASRGCRSRAGRSRALRAPVAGRVGHRHPHPELGGAAPARGRGARSAMGTSRRWAPAAWSKAAVVGPAAPVTADVDVRGLGQLDRQREAGGVVAGQLQAGPRDTGRRRDRVHRDRAAEDACARRPDGAPRRRRTRRPRPPTRRRRGRPTARQPGRRAARRPGASARPARGGRRRRPGRPARRAFANLYGHGVAASVPVRRQGRRLAARSATVAAGSPSAARARRRRRGEQGERRERAYGELGGGSAVRHASERGRHGSRRRRKVAAAPAGRNIRATSAAPRGRRRSCWTLRSQRAYVAASGSCPSPGNRRGGVLRGVDQVVVPPAPRGLVDVLAPVRDGRGTMGRTGVRRQIRPTLRGIRQQRRTAAGARRRRGCPVRGAARPRACRDARLRVHRPSVGPRLKVSVSPTTAVAGSTDNAFTFKVKAASAARGQASGSSCRRAGRRPRRRSDAARLRRGSAPQLCLGRPGPRRPSPDRGRGR